MQYFPRFAHLAHGVRRKGDSAPNQWETAYLHPTPHTHGPFTQERLAIGVASMPGHNNKHNSDSYWITEVYAPAPNAIIGANDGIGATMSVTILASSMNKTGQQSRVAQVAVEAIHTALRTPSFTPVRQQLTEAIRQAKEAIARYAANAHQADGEVAILIAALLEQTLYLAVIGDCRAYIIRQGTIRQLTDGGQPAPVANPVSVLAPAARQPVLSPPPNPLLRKHVGAEKTTLAAPVPALPLDPTAPRMVRLLLSSADSLLFCTPGLHHAVSEEAMSNAVTHHPPQVAAQQLAVQANLTGNRASHTVVIIEQIHAQTVQSRPREWQRMVYKALLAAGCLFLIVIQLFVFAQWGRVPARTIPMPQPVTVTTPPPPVRATPATAMRAMQPGGPPQAMAAATINEPQTLAPASDQSTGRDRPGVVAAKAPPMTQIVEQLWHHLALTTTLATFSQSVATTLETAGSALAAVRTATASAPTPTASPSPTPPPTLTPTLTTPLRRPTATPRPTQPATVQALPTQRSDFARAAIKVLEPAEYDTLSDKRFFRWQANFVLPPGYAFELIFWQHGQDPLKQGKGYGGLTSTEQANASYEHFRIRNAAEGEYRWGVLLVTKEPYRRIKYLGGDRVIYVKP